ncbi:MAG: peptidoglycan binding domain-containing protein [Chloroflexota bacterium]|nr:peptidoglycan binding domain-containing protein [Chloroflexota bacterium]
MTTRLSQLPLPLAMPGRLPWRSFGLAFLLTLLAAIVFVVAFAVGYTRFNEDRVLPGLTVAGVPLAGLDRASAEARLREALPSLSSGHLTVRFGDREERVGYAEIGRDYDMAAMLDQAFAVGRDGSVLEQAQEQVRVLLRGVAVEPAVRWDQAELERRLLSAAAAARSDPRNASIVRQGARYVVQPAAAGTTVDPNAGLHQALAAVGSLSPADAVVRVESVPLAPSLTTAEAQAFVDRVERVAAEDLLLVGGGVGERVSAETIRRWVRLSGTDPTSWTITVDRAPIDELLAQIAEKVYVPARNASFSWRGEAAVAVPGKDGRELDVEATANSILAALDGRQTGGGGSAPVSLSIAAVQPSFTTEQARELAPLVERLSSWTTNYTPSERNFFGANIQVPTRVVDGTVIEPGAKFDFWAVVGNLSDYPEIGPGGVIIRGRTDPTGALGGGICSCSTTIFNAALRAGLEMGARRNHAYYIDRYPVGLDATVFKSRSSVQNLTFTNDTDYPIILRGINETGKVIFEVWGVPTGRTVTFSEPRIENIKVAKDFYEYTDELPAGKTERIEYPTDGFEAWVTRTVTDAQGNVIHQETYHSKYIRVHGITLIGRSPGDPPAGTQIER